MPRQINNLNFEGQNIYVGFDTHLKSWKVTILSENLTLKTLVMPPKPDVLNNYLCASFPGAKYHSAYEAGFSGVWAHNQLCDLGIDNIIVNPADVPGTHKDRVQKEDKRDSRKIAKALRGKEISGIYVPSESTLNDRSFLRLRSTLVRDMVRFKYRIKSFIYFYGIELPVEFQDSNKHWTIRFLKWIEEIPMKEESGKQALKILVSEVRSQKELLKSILKNVKVLSSKEKYRENVILLKSIPGIGLITAMIILTEVDDINRFPNLECFSSYIGLIPTTQSSGENEISGDITPRANNFLRNAFIESAWVAVRLDPALLMTYNNLIKRMDSNKAIIRIAKKLANRTYSVLKNNKTYEYGRTENL